MDTLIKQLTTLFKNTFKKLNNMPTIFDIILLGMILYLMNRHNGMIRIVKGSFVMIKLLQCQVNEDSEGLEKTLKLFNKEFPEFKKWLKDND